MEQITVTCLIKTKINLLKHLVAKNTTLEQIEPNQFLYD